MLLKFLKIFFSVLALMLFLFLLDVTFYLNNYTKNSEIIESIIPEKDTKIYKYTNNGTGSFLEEKLANITTSTGVFVKNFNSFDKIYFSSSDSYDIKENYGKYEITLDKGLFLLDLNDLDLNYKIKGLGFEIIPKTAGMIFVDSTNTSKTLIFSLNSTYRFTFKSEKGRKVNYYYMYPHNYLLFNLKNNQFSRIGGDVFRLKTIVKEGFFDKKISENLELGGILTGYKLDFFTNVFDLLKKDNKDNFYKKSKIEKVGFFSVIGSKYIEKYFNYFINDSKKRVYLKQQLLNQIHLLFKSKGLNPDLNLLIINKLNSLKKFNLSDYAAVTSVIEGYYKIILKNHDLTNKSTLNNFLPLVKYIRLVDSDEIKSVDDLSRIISNNQKLIFQDKANIDTYKKNLEYLYVLRNIDKTKFNKIILNSELNYKKIVKSDINIKLEKYYFGLVNLKKGNDDIEQYVLLQDIYFSYNFTGKIYIEKYFYDFVDSYFSKLKIINGDIIIGKHIDSVLLESFVYYLEDYLNSFAFKKEVDLTDNDTIKINIDILEKYLSLNKVVYFNKNTISKNNVEMLRTGIFKNSNLLDKILTFIRYNLFDKERTSNKLLVTSRTNVLNTKYIEKLKNNLLNIFTYKNTYKDKLKNDFKQITIFNSYITSKKKYDEYFLALTQYEEYKSKYNKIEQELNDYYIKQENNMLGIEDIKKYLSQFYGSDLSYIKINSTETMNLYDIKNFVVDGGKINFLMNPERDYTISDIIIESDEKLRKRFFDKTYILEVEHKLIEEKQKYSKRDINPYMGFEYFFRNKFFNIDKKDNKNKDDNSDDIKDFVEESESLIVFKRDKLLGKTGEFSSISKLLKLKYNNIVVKDIENIFIKDAEIIGKLEQKEYLIDFNSKYSINLKENKHYFYNDGGIKLLVNTKGKEKKAIIGGNEIILDFKLNLSEFNSIFENLILEIGNISKLHYILSRELGVNNLDINYKKDGNFIVGFEFNGKMYKINLSGEIILYMTEDGKKLEYKDIPLKQEFKDILLKLK